MEPRTALVLALVSAGLAVGLVAADLAWTLEVQIQARSGDGWRTVTSTADQEGRLFARPAGPDCLVAGDAMRIVVDNDKPLSDEVDIRMWFYNDTRGREDTLFEETWALAAFEVREHTLTVPRDALPDGARNGGPKVGNLQVEADGRYLGACIEEAP